MRNKKGFTLIELLAVIVILAVIALITVPVVINIINNAKKGAAEDSAYGVIEAAKLYWVENSLEDTNNVVTFTYDGENSKWITAGDKELLISGTKPTGTNESSIVISSGNVSLNNVKFNGFTCNTNNEYKVVCESGSGSDQQSSGESGSGQGESGQENTTSQLTYKPLLITEAGSTHKGIVYLNPTDLEVECNENNSQIGTGTPNASGCMKFYVYDDSGDTYKMILDHNTTATVAWNSTGSNSEMKEVAEALSSDTIGWVGSPRLITAEEVAVITNTPILDETTIIFWFQQTGKNYRWLADYASGCYNAGTCDIEDSSTHGYWTSTPADIFYPNAWAIYSTIGLLPSSQMDDSVTTNNYLGVRPVITLSKSQIVTSKPTLITEVGSTHKGIVYLNPTDLEVECNENNSQIGTGTPNASGCMKFYVYDDSGDTYKMILDHNTTATVAWNSTGSNSEMKEVAEALSSDTIGWVGSPRLITAEEVAVITNTPILDETTIIFWFQQTGKNYRWLADYASGCYNAGTCDIEDSSTHGYWTSTPADIFYPNAWAIYSTIGLLPSSQMDDSVTTNNYLGVRPVITLPKYLIK